MDKNMKKYVVEAIGTFFLIFTIGLCVVINKTPMAPFAIGLILMVMVYAGGHISGGHYNPAVSLAAYMRGVLPKENLVPYWISQLIGTLIAAYTIVRYTPNGCPQCFRDVSIDFSPIIIVEFAFTFALCYVVLNTTTSKETESNSYYGAAIGLTVTAGAYAAGWLCIGAFNPAVTIAAYIWHIAPLPIICVTFAVNLLAGAVAAYVYNKLNEEPEEKVETKEETQDNSQN